MADQKQLNVKLSAEQYQRWKTAADDDPEYSSLSHLVRQAVERELAGDTQATTSGVESDAVEYIRETVEENREALTGIQNVVTAIHEATDEPDDRRAKAEVWSVLPESGEGMTPAAIADRLGGPFDATTVARYLDAMRQDDHVETADGTHYRRVE